MFPTLSTYRFFNPHCAIGDNRNVHLVLHPQSWSAGKEKIMDGQMDGQMDILAQCVIDREKITEFFNLPHVVSTVKKL